MSHMVASGILCGFLEGVILPGAVPVAGDAENDTGAAHQPAERTKGVECASVFHLLRH